MKGNSDCLRSQSWEKFTPWPIAQHLCMGRVWNSGFGGQCGRVPISGNAGLCEMHARQAKSKEGLSHGRVDGPVPAKKLAEFERTLSRNNGLPRRSNQIEATNHGGETSVVAAQAAAQMLQELAGDSTCNEYKFTEEGHHSIQSDGDNCRGETSVVSAQSAAQMLKELSGNSTCSRQSCAEDDQSRWSIQSRGEASLGAFQAAAHMLRELSSNSSACGRHKCAEEDQGSRSIHSEADDSSNEPDDPKGAVVAAQAAAQMLQELKRTSAGTRDKCPKEDRGSAVLQVDTGVPSGGRWRKKILQSPNTSLQGRSVKGLRSKSSMGGGEADLQPRCIEGNVCMSPPPAEPQPEPPAGMGDRKSVV